MSLERKKSTWLREKSSIDLAFEKERKKYGVSLVSENARNMDIYVGNVPLQDRE